MTDLLLAVLALLALDLVFVLVDLSIEFSDRRRRRKAWREKQRPMGRRTVYPNQMDMDISMEMVNRGRME